jgi:ribosomal protein L7Ae-like RNA K-turn-binding protein
MSNRPKPGTDSAVMQERHGRKGHVTLTTSVPPELKNHLVELCEYRGVTLKAAIQEALEAYLYRVDNTDRERWYGR